MKRTYIIGFLLILIVLVLSACGNDTTITMKEYNDIRNGMTYEDVCSIIGCNPSEVKESTYDYILEKSIVETQFYEGKNNGMIVLLSDLNGINSGAINSTDPKEVSDAISSMFDNRDIQKEQEIIEKEQEIIEKEQEIKEKERESYQPTIITLGEKTCKWYGEKINKKAEYRGYATIVFRQDRDTGEYLVVSKNQTDLK